jgi:hypothetical protein
MIDRHGGGKTIHCSRKSSSWIRVHMPSGTSQKTVSNRRSRSSSSAPAAVRGACNGPAPGSSQWRLCTDLSGPADPPTASSLGRHPPRGGLSCSHYAGARYTSTSRPRGAKSAHAPNKQQQMVSVSIHQTYELIYQSHKHKSQKYTTYLCDQKPPQEAISYPGPPGSPPSHRGTRV